MTSVSAGRAELNQGVDGGNAVAHGTGYDRIELERQKSLAQIQGQLADADRYRHEGVQIAAGPARRRSQQRGNPQPVDHLADGGVVGELQSPTADSVLEQMMKLGT